MPKIMSKSQSHRRSRKWSVAIRTCALGAMLALLAVAASAQKVAPRLTGTTVVSQLAKAEQAVKARAAGLPDAQLQAIVKQLEHMRTSLSQALGDDASQPLATIDKDERDAAVRAEAAARRVQAWLEVSATGCTRADTDAMLAALKVTLARLIADTSSQKRPLPVIDGVETLDRRPLFVLRQGVAAPKFVLTGANLVDARCENPEVVALGADGKPLAAQPQLIAAQPGRVELQWPGAANLAPGSYVLELKAQRKGFLFGCRSEPPTIAVLQVAPPLRFTVSYALSATCGDGTQSMVLGSGTLPTLTARQHTVARTIAVAACKDPSSYTVAATVRTANGPPKKFGPVTQSAAATITTGLGNGLTLSWDPSLHQLFVKSGKLTCKGVY